MKKLHFILVVLALLTGCEGSLEKGIREKANDPAAVQFKDKITYQDWACISVNGKNAFGGYVGFKRLMMQNFGYKTQQDFWIERKSDVECTKDTLIKEVQYDEVDAKTDKIVEATVLKAMADAKLIPASMDSYTKIEDRSCRSAATEAATDGRLAMQSRYYKYREATKVEYELRLAEFKKGNCNPPEGYENKLGADVTPAT